MRNISIERYWNMIENLVPCKALSLLKKAILLLKKQSFQRESNTGRVTQPVSLFFYYSSFRLGTCVLIFYTLFYSIKPLFPLLTYSILFALSFLACAIFSRLISTSMHDMFTLSDLASCLFIISREHTELDQSQDDLHTNLQTRMFVIIYLYIIFESIQQISKQSWIKIRIFDIYIYL